MDVVIDLTDLSVKADDDDLSTIGDVPAGPTVQSFNLPGRPTPWQRPKRNHYGAVYNPQKALQTRMKAILRQQMKGARLTGAVLVEIDFYFLRPRTHFQADGHGNLVRKPDRPVNCLICRDIDNLAKLVLDAMNGIAFDDDRQVVEARLRKRYSDVKYYYSDNAMIEEYTEVRILAL